MLIASSTFTLTYAAFSGIHFHLFEVFGVTYAFLFASYGLNYVFALSMTPSAAQMSAVASASISA